MFDSPGFLDYWLDGFATILRKLRNTTSEEFTAFCKKENISPIEVFAAANYLSRDLGEKSAYEIKKTFGGVVGYLEDNGFVYDKDIKRFREA